MTSPSADTMERARAALSAALRDPRCGVAVRMTMIGETCESFLDAIAQALHDAQEEARRERRRALDEARREVWHGALALSEIAKWPRFYFNRFYVEEWVIRTARILHRWGMDFEAVLRVHGHKQIKGSRLTKPEVEAAIRNQESSP